MRRSNRPLDCDAAHLSRVRARPARGVRVARECTDSRRGPRILLLLNRLDRYLLREVTWTFVAVTGVLLVVLMSNQFARVLGQAAQNDFPGRHRAHADRAHDAAAAHGARADRPVPRHRARARPALSRERDDGDDGLRRRAAADLQADRAAEPWSSRRCWPCCRSASCRRPGRRRQELRVAALRAAQFGALEPRPVPQLRRRRRGVLRRAHRRDGRTVRRVRAAQRRRQDRDRDGRARGAARRRARPSRCSCSTTGAATRACRARANWRIVEFREHGIPVQLPDTQDRSRTAKR